MWARLGTWVVQVIVIPLFQKGVMSLVNYFKNKRAEKELEEKNRAKGEAYDKADTLEKAKETFGDLP